MSRSTDRATAPGDRVLLPLSFDAAPLQADVRALGLGDFVEYSE